MIWTIESLLKYIFVLSCNTYMCTIYTQVLEDQYILLPLKKINFSYSITVLQTVMHN